LVAARTEASSSTTDMTETVDKAGLSDAGTVPLPKGENGLQIKVVK